MNQLIASSELTAVVGMGATGLSVARYLAREGQRFVMMDTRQAPANLSAIKREFPDVAIELGELRAESLCAATRIVLSPGLPLKQPAIQAALAEGRPVVGDIQLFVEHLEQSGSEAALVAITGSNGKSTVTTLVGEMLRRAGRKVAVGGNLGTAALDLLQAGEVDVYVLELSSFQLETSQRLNARVATVLNVSLDHMDRYAGIADYHAAKQRIFFGARAVVFNRDDALTQPPLASGVAMSSFGLDRPDLKQFGLIRENGETWLARGLEKLISARELKLAGTHNLANALAALAICQQLGVEMQAAVDCLRDFEGLPHRCTRVAEKNGVEFIDDSKGTNVGATLAALEGLARQPGKIVLIAGGDGKGADFSALAPAMREQLRSVVCIGRDGPRIAAVAQEAGVAQFAADNMLDAVKKAAAEARPGDAVLLSPACASLDMFRDYIDRGEQFAAAVHEVLQ